MSDLVKGVLGCGWSLLVGWILPSAVNLLILGLLVVPALGASGPVGWFNKADPKNQALALIAAAIVLGVVLAALQKPLYRMLEGYLGWHPPDPGSRTRSPRAVVGSVLDYSRRRQLDRKQVLLGRLDLVELSELEKKGELRAELSQRLGEVRADPRLERYAGADAQRGPSQLGLLREQIRRYPVDDNQVAPTRLGNAVRRLEEYGYDRFRLDSQTLWYELFSTASEQTRKQVDQARTTMDFLVCLLYGHLVVAVGAVAALFVTDGRVVTLTVLALCLTLLSWFWYRIAVVSTDDWAAATRAMVNVGRTSLAAELGLQLPADLTAERDMWGKVSRLAARPYDSRSAEIDVYRKLSEDAAVQGGASPPA